MRKLKLPERRGSEIRLDANDIALIQRRGIEGVKSQVREIVETRIENDRPVPPRGNPVFKAMHACNATSARDLRKSHGLSTDGGLSSSGKDAIVNLLTRWIVREFNYYREEMDNQRNLEDFRPRRQG